VDELRLKADWRLEIYGSTTFWICLFRTPSMILYQQSKRAIGLVTSGSLIALGLPLGMRTTLASRKEPGNHRFRSRGLRCAVSTWRRPWSRLERAVVDTVWARSSLGASTLDLVEYFYRVRDVYLAFRLVVFEVGLIYLAPFL